MATLAESPLTFTRLPHPAPVAVATRDQLLADPGFGKLFSDHMVTIDWSEDAGWHNASVGPLAAIPLHPAAAVLHYAQEIFEGLKAYRLADGTMALFRPEANAARFNASARRLAMPALPEDLFVAACRELVAVDGAWFPEVEGGSLYLRPFMVATEAFLGVRPAKSYKFIVIASPAGNYFKSGAPAVSIWVSQYTRAAPGGTGAAKCGGNYAASLVPQAEAMAHGHDQVVFLDAEQHKWIEELGGMNLYFVFDDGSLVTPPLSGTPAGHHPRKPAHAGARGRADRARGEVFDRPVARRRGEREAGGDLRLRDRRGGDARRPGDRPGQGRVRDRLGRPRPVDAEVAPEARLDPARRGPRPAWVGDAAGLSSGGSARSCSPPLPSQQLRRRWRFLEQRDEAAFVAGKPACGAGEA